MPHIRERYLLKIIEKKLRFAPVVTVQGARQTGKSVLIRDILPKSAAGLIYKTFDAKVDRDFASRNPDTFLKSFLEAKTLAIDEAQKAPAIFEAVKLEVDQRKRPGRYILLGSTEFCKLTKIRESLTGRMSRARLFPFTLSESLNKPFPKTTANNFFLRKTPDVSREEFLRFLSRGGMPGMFAVHNSAEREGLIRDFIELSVYRDALGFHGVKIDGDLCFDILTKIAVLDEPNISRIASSLKKDPRTIKTHLEVLKTLFLIHSLDPHPSGTGKTLFFILDVALADYLGADFERKLYTYAVQTCLANLSYSEDTTRRYHYYRSSRGTLINLIESRPNGAIAALKILPEERIDMRELAILKAFKEKQGRARLYAIAPCKAKVDEIAIEPWESLA